MSWGFRETRQSMSGTGGWLGARASAVASTINPICRFVSCTVRTVVTGKAIRGQSAWWTPPSGEQQTRITILGGTPIWSSHATRRWQIWFRSTGSCVRPPASAHTRKQAETMDRSPCLACVFKDWRNWKHCYHVYRSALLVRLWLSYVQACFLKLNLL